MALQSDPRFSYALYVPDKHYLPTPDSPRLPLLVVVHGTLRSHLPARDALIPLANAPDTACAILAPLFPAGISGLEDLGGYKRLVVPVRDGDKAQDEIRYDQLLLAMIDEVTERYPGIATERFLLAGYSGGGQYAHRFLYLHPERILATSVGAPGETTLITESHKWPRGTSDIEGRFPGHGKLDIGSLRRVPIQIAVGQHDTSTEQFSLAKQIDEERTDSRSRVEKAQELFRNWQENELDVRIDVVPGVAHSREGCHEAVSSFLESQLKSIVGSRLET